MLPKLFILSLLLAGAMHAEFLRMEVFIRDMSRPSCTDTPISAFKKMRGVEHVDVNSRKAPFAWTSRLRIA